jgi:hypothetical protein
MTVCIQIKKIESGIESGVKGVLGLVVQVGKVPFWKYCISHIKR